MSNAAPPPLAPRPARGEVLGVVRSHLRPGSFPLLLATTVLLYGLNGLAIASRLGEILAQLGYAAVLCAGLYFLSVSRLSLLIGAVAISATVVLNVDWYLLDIRVRHLLQDSTSAAFIFWLLAFVLREVFRRSNVERDAIIGALGGFLLMIFAFARLHGLIEAWAPGSYAFQGVEPSLRANTALVAAFQYFSTVTTTTVGFGDIVPVSPAARLLTGLQAITGQLYLAVVVAALVGRAVAERR
ncbi:hypothetical protein KF840_25725 [bacterium]|nr:hypothetical protein [bacterium]